MEAFKRNAGTRSLARSRTVGVGFAVVMYAMVATAQLDHSLPLARLVLAYACNVLLLAAVVSAFVTKRVSWVATIGTPVLIVGTAQALAVEPASVGMCLALIAAQSLYGSGVKAIVGTAGVVAAQMGYVMLQPVLNATGDADLSQVGGPVPVLIMFSALLRALYSAMHQQELAAVREAMLARTSRALLGITEEPAAYALVREALTELAGLTPGLGLAIAKDDGSQARVGHSAGMAEPGTAVARQAVAACGADHRLIPVAAEVADRLAGPGKSRLVLGMRLGRDPHHLLLASVKGKLPVEIADMLYSLTAQLSLVEDACASHAQLVTMAMHDQLTTISNRAAFVSQLSGAVDAAAGQEPVVGLMLIDLDDFKMVNDTFGHAAGDRVLVEVAGRMSQLCGERAVPGRFGGDEFALFVADAVSAAEIDALAEQLRDSLIRPIPWQDGSVQVGASIGVVNGVPGATAGDLMRCADIAMYSAKAMGKNRVVRFTDEEHGSIAQVRTRESHLREAIERDEMVLHYQPIVDLETCECVGLEALVRWQHPTLGLLLPASFLPIAERDGQIIELGQHILERACREVVAVGAAYGRELTLAVNLSASQLQDDDFHSSVRATLGATGLRGELLQLEVPEQALTERGVAAALAQLHGLGAAVVLDHFTGEYTTLATLRAVTVSRLKVDRRTLEEHAGTAPVEELLGMVGAVAALLGAELTAKAVETADDEAWVTQQGIRCAQGFGIARPLPVDELTAWLAAVASRQVVAARD